MIPVPAVARPVIEYEVAGLGHIAPAGMIGHVEVIMIGARVRIAGVVDGGFGDLRDPCRPCDEHRAPFVEEAGIVAQYVMPVPIAIFGIVGRAVYIGAVELADGIALVIADLGQRDVDEVEALIAGEPELAEIVIIDAAAVIAAGGVAEGSPRPVTALG